MVATVATMVGATADGPARARRLLPARLRLPAQRASAARTRHARFSRRVGTVTLDGGRVLIVGGGTRPSPEPDAPPGNGRATAIVCAREGADVTLVDLDLGAAEHTAELVRAEGGQAWAVQADVSDAEACARMVMDAHAAMGGLDGLVLNVGIGLGGGLEHTT